MQFDITTNPTPAPRPVDSPPFDAILHLLQQMLEQQRQHAEQVEKVLVEHLNHAKAVHQEHLMRYRNLFGRWEKDFPDLPGQCKQIYPAMEKTYMSMIANLSQELAEQDPEAFESEFALHDFIDRHGMRLGQFGHLLSIIGPLSEAGASPQK